MSNPETIEAQHRCGRLARLIHALAACPPAFDLLRWVLEFGYIGEKRVLKRERLVGSARVLDLGCGTGTMAGMFAPDAYTGLDFRAAYIRRARRKHPGKRFLVGDGQSLPFADSSFDAVVIGGVLHHLEATVAARVLAEVRRVLVCPGGQLLLWEDVPAERGLNIVGRLINRLDEGDSIRSAEQYRELVASHLHVERQYSMTSGLCEYTVIVAAAG